MLIFGPTLEAENEGAILTVHPVQSLKDGLFRDMPWMTGVTEEEGLLKSASNIFKFFLLIFIFYYK